MLSALLILTFALKALAVAGLQPTTTLSALPPSFTYNNDTFLLNGEPFVIIGGQMDPQRIPPIYWRDRLSKARAMGLNTVFSYVYWNLLEPEQGQWRSDEESNNIAAYFKIAQEVGLQVVLRPGPYICGEREYGGFPAWLSQVPGMVVRSNNGPFLNASQNYLNRLANDLRDLQVTRGGPLLMVQAENEYGSYSEDHNYTTAVRDILRANFEVPLYTNDGGTDWTLRGGEIPTVLAEIDGDPVSGFRARQQYITDASELGPLLDGEYYTYAFDIWGSSNPHNTTVGRPQAIEGIVKDMNFILSANNSVSLYVFHGGSNFGFSNGALYVRNRTDSFITSYDYGAPLDESGRTTDLYFTLRDLIQQYVPNGSIPAVPANLQRLAVPDIVLSPVVSLFDTVNNKTSASEPLTMEGLGQAYGFVLYEHQATSSTQGILKTGDRARDRVLVFVNGIRQGVVDSSYNNPANVTVSLKAGDKFQLLVENLGRVDYATLHSPVLEDQQKGIKGSVTIGGYVIEDWDMYRLPLEEISTEDKTPMTPPAVTSGSPPLFYHGTFSLNSTSSDPSSIAQLDTFIAVPNGTKGNVWVNGFNLGRYWIIGPQQSLYCPGTILNPNGVNEIVVLELEPGVRGEGTMVARGLSEREWANYPDPDAP